jgi:magnesium transporter
MLSFHSSAAKGDILVAKDAKTIPPEVNWINAVRPDAREIDFLERALGIEVPTLASLSEIETSRRLRSEKDWLYISIPMIYRPEGFIPGLTPRLSERARQRALAMPVPASPTAKAVTECFVSGGALFSPYI